MFIKPVVLALAVVALLTTAAWSLGAIDVEANCADQEDSQTRGRPAPDAGINPTDGATQELRFAYDELFDASRAP